MSVLPRLSPIILTVFVIWLSLLQSVSTFAFDRPPHHKLILNLQTQPAVVQAEDTLTLYPNGVESNTLTFLLDGRYTLAPLEIPHKGNWKINTSQIKRKGRPLHQIRVTRPDGEAWPDFVQIIFRYHGPYRDLQVPKTGADPDSSHTLVLAGESLFYPVLEGPEEDKLLTFSLETVTPPEWQVVSQGKRTGITTGEGRIATIWSCDDPMEEIFLIADRYHEYKERLEDVSLYVFLRQPDPDLATQYLDATRSYIQFYQKLIGPYPFVKMAVVENSEQTGYGMPSFTLMGSRIIRFPFILHTSLPHEILHNWWGNGVYIDPSSGNWSEGLTAYLSDHLFPDLKGRGPQIRFQELMKYRSFVNNENDFPLSAFKSRTDMASQAIGYGKWLMVLHMLRQKVGNETFLDGLNEFYMTHLFKRAGFDDLRRAMERVSRQNLKPFFTHWTQTKGAPELELSQAEVQTAGDAGHLTLTLAQTQEGPIHPLSVPVYIAFQDDRPLRRVTLDMTRKKQAYTVPLQAGEVPAMLQVDPYHDLFRRLHRDEVPPSIGQTFGDEHATVSLDSTAENSTYRQVVEALGSPLESPSGSALGTPHSLWMLGRNHPAAEKLSGWLEAHGVRITDHALEVESKTFAWGTHSAAITVPHPLAAGKSVTWIIVQRPGAVAGLMRKLPHYGKYGLLVFEGDAPDNVLKSIWPVSGSRMVKHFGSSTGLFPRPARPPLVAFKPFE